MSKNIYKVPYHVKKQIENELYHYWENIKELKELEDDILEASASSDGQPRSNTTSDTTAQKALKLTSTRTILALKRRLLYIENAIKRLNPEEKEVVKLSLKIDIIKNLQKHIKTLQVAYIIQYIEKLYT